MEGGILLNYSLQFRAILLFVSATMIMCFNPGRVASLPFNMSEFHKKQKEGSLQSSGVVQYSRSCYLYSERSNKFVAVNGRKITATEPERTRNALFKAKSQGGESRLTLQNVQSNRFVCFNKKGKLVMKHSGDSNLCVFKETPDVMASFISEYNTSWSIAFSKKGKPLRATSRSASKRNSKSKKFIIYSSESSPLRPVKTNGLSLSFHKLLPVLKQPRNESHFPT